MKQILINMLFGIIVAFAFASSPLPALGDANLNVPDSKRTTLGLYITASEAYARWKADPQSVTIIDVRTPEEYVFVGHPEMSWNIPLKRVTYKQTGKGRTFTLEPNAAFLSQVKQVVQPKDTVLLICRSGGRSAVATNLLAKAGFKQVFSVINGFEGDKVNDPKSSLHGKRRKNGWKNSGVPWGYDIVPGKMLLPADAPEQQF